MKNIEAWDWYLGMLGTGSPLAWAAQCIDCLKCDGHHKSISINPHGARAAKHPSNKKVT